MLYYDRIDVSEGTDINKKKSSKECDICYYWHFLDNLDKGSPFQPYVCNGCYDILILLF